MKTKIKLTTIILLTSFMFMLSDISAQDMQRKPQGPPPIPSEKQIEKMISDLETKLSLSESQKQKMTKIMSDHFKTMKTVQEKYKKSHDAERKEMETLKGNFDNEIKSVLSKEQSVLFEEFMKEKRPRNDRKMQKPQGKKQGK